MKTIPVTATIYLERDPCARCTGSGRLIEAAKTDGSPRNMIVCPDCSGVPFSFEIEVCVEAFYTPKEPDVYNLPNGDPGYPGHPEEIEIIGAVNVATGETVELTAGEIEQAEQAIREEAGE